MKPERILARDRKNYTCNRYEYALRLDALGGLLSSRFNRPLAWGDFHTPRTETPVRFSFQPPMREKTGAFTMATEGPVLAPAFSLTYR